jgi:hypothetical protein
MNREALERIKGYCCEVTHEQWREIVEVAYEVGVGVGHSYADNRNDDVTEFNFAQLDEDELVCLSMSFGEKTIPFPDFLAKLKCVEEWQPKAQPENRYPMLMWVGGTQDEVDEKRLKRVVFMEKCGLFLSWYGAESFEQAEKSIGTSGWRFAKPVTEAMTITPRQIREAFNCDEFVISEEQ